MCRFSFHRRRGIFYCQLYNPTLHQFSTAKSTGTTNRDEAVLVADGWLRNGIPSGRIRNVLPASQAFTLEAIVRAIRDESFTRDNAEAVLAVLVDRGFVHEGALTAASEVALVLDFLKEFWDEDKSLYVRGERARGRTISLRHIREMARIVERYWSKPFEGLHLGELHKADVRTALVYLSERGGEGGKPLSPGTIGKAFTCLSTAMKWAEESELISVNPCKGVRRTVGTAKVKGILTDEEVSALFRLKWADERAKAAFLVAVTCGLRRGEIVALQAQDIGDDRLYIRHAWNDDDRLKAPKNGKSRESALLPVVRAALLELIAENPHGNSPSAFIFYGAEYSRPLDGQIISRAFDDALAAIKIDEATRKARSLSFHSLRHGYAKAMAARIEIQQAMKATGHSTPGMLEHYADHKNEADFKAILNAADDAFGKVLAFRKGA